MPQYRFYLYSTRTLAGVHHRCSLVAILQNTLEPTKKISEFSMTATKQQFHLLPHFLVVSFNRRMLPFKDDINTTTTTTTAANAIPISTRSSHAQSTPAKDLPRYHATTIELPLELDLGFYLDPAATMPAHAGFRKDSRIPTFYRLHGFVTQSQAHFMDVYPITWWVALVQVRR
ncbi:hypothetical protein BASA62_005740 [Batrachochytrium salamandrivorans]|nr:hypothetical protein BASA62_005740 [Batrachochytrium salamandrivorans]